MNRIIKLFLTFVFSFLTMIKLFTNDVNAAFTMSVLNVDPTIISANEQEIMVTATISGLPNPSFFRAELQKSSGDTYFGYSKNNSDNWVKVTSDQDCTNYYSVTDTNITSLVLFAKIGVDNSPENGTYLLKLRRYTSTCGSNSDSDPVSIQIGLPTPSPTPTQNPTTIPTHITTPTPVKTIAPTPLKTATPKPSPTPVAEQTPEVLGQEATQPPETVYEDPTPIPTNSPEVNRKTAMVVIGVVFLCLGIIAIGVAAYMTFVKTKTLTP